MWLSLLLLIVGFALIVKGGDLFVSSSVRIAELLRVPRVLIGSTLVSLATTSPELVVSATASFRGEPGLAIGNAVGSCIANIALIVGTLAVLRPVSIRPHGIRMPLWIMIGLGVLLLPLTADLRLGSGRGALLVLLAAGYTGYDFYRHKTGGSPDLARESVEETIGASSGLLRSGGGASIVFLGGAAMVIAGSRLLVDSAIVIAKTFGVPPIVIGLTVVAVGTSLPEYATAITSARKGVSDLSVGNVLGANILNLGLVVGVSAIIHEVEMSRVTQLYNFPAMLFVMGTLAWSLLRFGGLTRGLGWGLLFFYVLYVVGLVGLAVGGYVALTE